MSREDILTTLSAFRGDLNRFGVKSLRLFGSAARDEASQESDVDLLVGFEATPTYSEFMKLRIFLEDLLGAKVDLVTRRASASGSAPSSRKTPSVSPDSLLFLWSC